MDERARLLDEENRRLFGDLFPNGPAGNDVLEELAPDGWGQSELYLVVHPTVEMRFEEAVRFHHNLENLPWRRKADEDKPRPPPPTIEEIRKSHEERPVDAPAECLDIVTHCLWDIFSDNHEVIAPDGRVADIGSFRGAAGFIADWLNALLREERYDYMNFYMGTIWMNQRADMSPAYRLIFRRLKALGYDWEYSFPRLGVVRFGPLPQKEEPGSYDPSAAFEKEQEEARRKKEFEDLREDLRQGYNESVRKSRELPAPELVKAYMNIYGHAPKGWPPVED